MLLCFLYGYLWVMGFEEDGTAQQGKKHAGGMFFSPGENPWMTDGKQYACWLSSIFLHLAGGIRTIQCNSPFTTALYRSWGNFALYNHSILYFQDNITDNRIPHNSIQQLDLLHCPDNPCLDCPGLKSFR